MSGTLLLREIHAGDKARGVDNGRGDTSLDDGESCREYSSVMLKDSIESESYIEELNSDSDWHEDTDEVCRLRRLKLSEFFSLLLK